MFEQVYMNLYSISYVCFVVTWISGNASVIRELLSSQTRSLDNLGFRPNFELFSVMRFRVKIDDPEGTMA